MSVQEDALYSIICSAQVLEVHTEAWFFARQPAVGAAQKPRLVVPCRTLRSLVPVLHASCGIRTPEGGAVFTQTTVPVTSIINTMYAAWPPGCQQENPKLVYCGRSDQGFASCAQSAYDSLEGSPGCSHMCKYKSLLISHSLAPPCFTSTARYSSHSLSFFCDCLGALYSCCCCG